MAGLLAASLAYGRVDLFRPKIESLLAPMGKRPAAFVRELDLEGARGLLTGFVYRFNVGADLAVLLLGMGRILREHGSLEAVFAEELERTGTLHGALSGFTRSLRSVPLQPIEAALGPARGLDHLLPSPLGPGAAKRLLMYLRWMVRGPDAVDFGIWRRVPASALVIPLDTHIARLSRRLGLTTRKADGWKTAQEITDALRLISPDDPVSYDFALCHHGMSGTCPATPIPMNCKACVLRTECRVGRRVR